MENNKDNSNSIGLSEDELSKIMDDDNFEFANENLTENKLDNNDSDLSILDDATDYSSRADSKQNENSLDGLMNDLDVSDQESDIEMGLDLSLETKKEEMTSIKDDSSKYLESDDINVSEVGGNSDQDDDLEVIDLDDLDDSVGGLDLAPEKTIVKPSAKSPQSTVKTTPRFTISTTKSKSTKSPKPDRKPIAKVSTSRKPVKTTAKATNTKVTKPTKAKVTKTIKSIKKPTKNLIIKNTKKISPTNAMLNQRINDIDLNKIWQDEVKLKRLFLQLDEMLGSASNQQIKQFALSPEYDLYLAILQKLGV